MTGGQSVVIVAQNPMRLRTLVSWVESAGHDVMALTTFKAAKAAIDARPALLITDLKLGAFNGLHLCLRARTAGIPSVVIGPADPVLRRDATEIGALYLTSTVRQRELVDLVAEYVQAPLESTDLMSGLGVTSTSWPM
jgi:DNA-binding response OmpR family regulator